MKRTKSLLLPLHNGFIFLEVVLAIAMVGIMLTSILSLQSTIYSRVVFNARRIERLLPLKEMGTSFLIESLQKDEYSRKKMNEDLAMTITYSKEPIKEGSELARFKGLFKENIVGSWEEWKGPQTIQLLRFVFVPEKGKEKEEKQ